MKLNVRTCSASLISFTPIYFSTLRFSFRLLPFLTANSAPLLGLLIWYSQFLNSIDHRLYFSVLFLGCSWGKITRSLFFIFALFLLEFTLTL